MQRAGVTIEITLQKGGRGGGYYTQGPVWLWWMTVGTLEPSLGCYSSCVRTWKRTTRSDNNTRSHTSHCLKQTTEQILKVLSKWNLNWKDEPLMITSSTWREWRAQQCNTELDLWTEAVATHRDLAGGWDLPGRGDGGGFLCLNVFSRLVCGETDGLGIFFSKPDTRPNLATSLSPLP